MGRWAGSLTSLNWTKPSSPRELTTSLPISFEMYSCTMLMVAERKGVSWEGAMMAVLVVGFGAVTADSKA